MAKIKRIVTSEVDGRNLSDFYGDNSLAMDTNGVINYYGLNDMNPLIGPGVVYGANYDSSDGYGYNTLKLIPHAPNGSVIDDRFIIVDPTYPNHIHLRAGGAQDASNAEIILGAEKTNVVVSDSARDVKVHSRVQQQVMAHQNINNEPGNYLITTDVVSAVGGWTVEVDGIRYEVAQVLYNTPSEGQTQIFAPSAPFVWSGVYNFFSPDYSNEWVFSTNGTLTGPGQNGTVKVNGLWGQDVSPLYLLGPESVVISGDAGEFLGDPTNPARQIAIVGDIAEAVPQGIASTDSPTFDKIFTSHNSDGTNIKIGDDAWIGDVDTADSIAIIGVEEPSNGGIVLGNAGVGSIAADAGELFITSSGAMTIEAVGGDMNFYMDGAAYIGDSLSQNRIARIADLPVSPLSASYYSTQDQSSGTAGSIQPMTVNSTDWETGITVVDSSKITFQTAGKYNIAFSAQLDQQNASSTIYIWLNKNGQLVPNSNTRFDIHSNDPFQVAAWNFFVNASQNDYYEIMWRSMGGSTVLQYLTDLDMGSEGVMPSIPSVILTVNRVG